MSEWGRGKASAAVWYSFWGVGGDSYFVDV